MEKTPFEMPDINLVERLSAQLIALNRELEEANRSLKESERARAEMFENISHDLRAPLTAIRGALDRLNGGNRDEEERRELLAILDRRVTTLEHLVGDLYYSVSLEQPNFSLRREHLAIAPFLEEWFITRQHGDASSSRELRLELDRELEAVAELDPDRMVRVLDNLMENAIRFSDAGDRITLSCRQLEPGGELELVMRDTGFGIRPEDLPHIFKRTYTAAHSRMPGGGSGLGLSITQTIVEKHGGSIWCESEPGMGSAFFVRLPTVRG